MSTEDPVMDRIRKAIEKSGLTQQELGEKMGYPSSSARQSVSQFLAKTTDPRISVVRRVAKALGIGMCELVKAETPYPSKKFG